MGCDLVGEFLGDKLYVPFEDISNMSDLESVDCALLRLWTIHEPYTIKTEGIKNVAIKDTYYMHGKNL